MMSEEHPAAHSPDRAAIAVVADDLRRDRLAGAVHSGGGVLVEPAHASGLVFGYPDEPGRLAEVLAAGQGIEWVQLPFAGIEAFAPLIDESRQWTSAKGIFGAAVAEYCVGMAIVARRQLIDSLKAGRWDVGRAEQGTTLAGTRWTILGGGGIARELIDRLDPFGATVSVVSRRGRPVAGAAATYRSDGLLAAVADADVVVVALPLTDETRGIVDRLVFDAMKRSAWLINVGRGAHVVAEDILPAIENGSPAGVILDVTDPEPLPDDSPLWGDPRVVITPHIANTRAMGVEPLADLVRRNVEAFRSGRPLDGRVDPRLGY